MRPSRIMVCAALVAGLVVAGAGAASARCETVWVDVYDIQVDVERNVYRFGERARIDVTVTRTDSGTPVAEADVFAYIPFFRKDGLVGGWGRTDAVGHGVAYLKLKRKYLRPGPTKLRVLGFKETADAASCVQVVEYGETRLSNAFRIEP